MAKNNKIQENIVAHNQIAEKYDLAHPEIYNEIEQDRIKKTIRKLLNISGKKNPKILDFGAGTGNLTKHFLEFGCEVTACDVSQKSLDVLKKKFEGDNNLKTRLISGEKLPFKDNSFDIVATYSVLHHIPDYLLAVREMIRVTKKGGITYIDHEVNNNRWYPNPLLREYYNKSKRSKIEKSMALIKRKDFLKYVFYRNKMIKLFINPRFMSQGDLHVFIDDHIEWEKIYQLVKKDGCKIIKKSD